MSVYYHWVSYEKPRCSMHVLHKDRGRVAGQRQTLNPARRPVLLFFAFSDQLRNSYQIGYDGSLRILYASGLDSHYQTEPHVLAGTANPTVAKRNMTLPGENGQNLVEWRFRKEQTQGKVNVFGRKLRVSMQAFMVSTAWSLSERKCEYIPIGLPSNKILTIGKFTVELDVLAFTMLFIGWFSLLIVLFCGL